MKRLLLRLLACLLPLLAQAQAQTIPVPTKNGQPGGVPAVAGDPLYLSQIMGFFGGKQDLNGDYSGGHVTPTGMTSPRTLADTLGQVLSPSWLQPVFLASALGGVVANDGTDQVGHINNALVGLPTGGARLLLPCGINLISDTVRLKQSGVTIDGINPGCATLAAMNTFLGGTFVTASISGTTLTLSGGATTSSGAIGYPVTGQGSGLISEDTVITAVLSSTQYTLSQSQNVASESMLIGGDMVDIAGRNSGLRDIGFGVQKTAAQVTSGNDPFRTSGYDVNMIENDQFVEDFLFSGCFVCVRIGAGGGRAVDNRGIMQFIADGVANPGSGGVLVDNTGPGPENYIESTYIYPNLPGLGGGPTLYQPGYGYKIVNSGATHMHDNGVTQAKYGLLVANICCVLIAGAGAAAETTQLYPIMKTKWLGGLMALASLGGQSGTALNIADAYSSDTTMADTTVFGWAKGVDLAPGASRVSLHDNWIGNYGFFTVGSKTNGTAIVVESGTGDDLDIHDNHLIGNTTAPLTYAATGTNGRVHDNPGYNPVGPVAVTVGPSPFSVPTGPTADEVIITGSGVTSVLLANPGAAGVGVCNAACTVHREPWQIVAIAYTGGAPTVTRNIH